MDPARSQWILLDPGIRFFPLSKAEQFGGNIDFVIIQIINTVNIRNEIVVEAKCDALGKGFLQLLLTLKSIWDLNNDTKFVYEFVTTVINWLLVTYDGQVWKLSKPSIVLLPNMEKQEDQ
ncbi:unnamed protein product [Rotaria socialis]|uniref:Uncharacterized protein n=1 Tax=Rotaria socialis TaxID=392032 RepID=A0A821GN26_9BILA|nr:unnamed protein product [Rotaria socialis]CAF4669957.1 unnamed protein product [Rotaria socialis]